MRPDIEQLMLTLRRGKGRFVPMIELGVHPKIKERLLGREIQTLRTISTSGTKRATTM